VVAVVVGQRAGHGPIQVMEHCNEQMAALVVLVL
jgi:hypothetical protein